MGAVLAGILLVVKTDVDKTSIKNKTNPVFRSNIRKVLHRFFVIAARVLEKYKTEECLLRLWDR